MAEPAVVPASLADRLRVRTADNPGPFTLEGTRTYVVGSRQPAVVDPGPDVDAHARAVARLVAGADAVTLVLTHGHGDHAGALDTLLALLEGRGVPVRVAGAGHARAEPLGDGDVVETDAGPLVALHTPGHTPDHLAFHWPAADAAFPGDLLLGEGDTTWVAGHPRCVADYLESLDRLRALGTAILLPAHGPPLTDPSAAIDRFEAHRRRRIEQVRAARAEAPNAGPEELVERIYGDEVPPGLRGAAAESVKAVLDYLAGR